MPTPVGSTPGVGAGSARRGDHLETVNRANFDQRVLKAQGPVAVEFMSYGCPDCREAEPHVQKVAEQLAGKVTMFRVNVPVEQALKDRFGVHTTPTFIMFQNGREVGRAEWPDPNVEAIKSAITRAFRS